MTVVMEWLNIKDWYLEHQEYLEILGFINYNSLEIKDGFQRWKYALFVLVYVAYLNFSVFTRRQMISSKGSAERYEDDDYEDRSWSMMSTLSERASGTKINLVYIVYKARRLWPIFDFLSRQAFRVLVLVLVIFVLHWQLSVSNLIYIACVLIYFVNLPRAI